jgi:ribonucleoside-diphosphate reductase beta chain
MSDDIDQWKSGALSSDEKLLVRRCLGFFAGSESLVGNNLLLTVARWITDAECGQYIMRQAYEESLHNWTVVTCCDSFNLKVNDVYEAYINIPSIKAKDDFLMSITTSVNRADFSTSTLEGKKEFLRNLVIYYIVCEGTFFFSGFAMLLALGKQNKLPGLSDQIRYTLRDESLHIKFGTYLINTIKEQYPSVWTKKFETETIDYIKKAVDLEVAYAHDVLPRGILGLNAEMFIDYMKYIGNRRLEGIGIDYRFDSDSNPFPWLSELVDTQPMTNFFERKVKDYQSSGMLEDDF